uniref:Uncharacterized protein n=1 Tax=Fibrocapsa japonica TaxID=94617 RepID=A0A7S2XYY4_9STRA
MKYTHYLSDVVENLSEDYPEIQDLLNRYKTLQVASGDLSQAQKKHEAENEEKRIEFANFKKERTNEILNFNNEIANLQKKLETMQIHVINKQNMVDGTIRGVSDKTLDLGQILNCVENLLERCTEGQKSRHPSRRQDKAKKPDRAFGEVLDINAEVQTAMERLDEIATYMIDYRDICDEYMDERNQKKNAQQVAFNTQSQVPAGASVENI